MAEVRQYLWSLSKPNPIVQMAFLILGVYFSPRRALSSSNTRAEREKRKTPPLQFAKYITFSLFPPEG